ncbi:isopentenyl-diphosphate Delta-isomerase [Nesterenkonia sp. LB17]|uniref:isopentenyl-diphosphate Delta-isomerase n=1 Tax=unclassified Nesterenkonia TaxID=2629769 RepID=UPI001F4CE048|nr:MULTISPECIES: isopentenyl-diphosphate Delta-isomerase [unclassified Nesterenkonia]MCH8560027.1 isopentenyl-diphosphate Delta-isomerase [Nesterenkonia sp. DZ6]MCH8562207.1 isopentenyl-diphosphate Delta-isomerase [Nesterenkonia sp. YGD6]MCH8564260.1 isopentenyl-diphosphate Delta-isomerase [Nesterenkonia sp. LB17]MCH8569889.1 isopentenyl-diphosphate Delta-isomerase [Nesterenkonia sp. AY15]
MTSGSSSTEEHVVLLSEAGAPVGSAPKATVHTADTPLHLGFSCYLFDAAGQLLLTRRALSKTTWPGVWTNSFCGHPGLEEELTDAVRRRAHEELGAELTEIRAALPEFRYRAVDASGVVENEICPVFTAVLTSELAPVDDEVSEWQFCELDAVKRAVADAPFAFSPWMVEQLAALEHLASFKQPGRGATA